MEPRGQQELNLILDTHATCNSRTHEHKTKISSISRWIRIGSRASRKDTLFQNLLMHINEDSLREAFQAQDGSKALGVDGVSKKAYGKNLEENLKELSQRIQKGTYRPMPKKEILIPKGNGKTRPIAIACFEDKLVDWCVGKILTTIYEPGFSRASFGYRPGHSCHGAIKMAYNSIGNNERPQVVEIDFKNFFNTIPHKKLIAILSKRIKDQRFKGLIGRFLRGEILNSTGETLPSEIGTPQGSIMSPILANIFLDEVIDQWFKSKYASATRTMVRYADDSIFLFKKKDEAESFLVALRERVQEFDLTLNEEKTQIVELTKNLHNQFDFLGFTFYWGKQGKRRILKIKTQKEKLIKGTTEFYYWIKKNRNRMRLSKIWEIAKAKIQGHINYYGYLMNGLKINYFIQGAVRALFKWLNRRSQKRSYTWEGFNERLQNFPLSPPLGDLKLKTIGWNPYAIAK